MTATLGGFTASGTSRFVQVGDLRMHPQVTGARTPAAEAAPPLVSLHGGGPSLATMRNLVNVMTFEPANVPESVPLDGAFFMLTTSSPSPSCRVPE